MFFKIIGYKSLDINYNIFKNKTNIIIAIYIDNLLIIKFNKNNIIIIKIALR